MLPRVEYCKLRRYSYQKQWQIDDCEEPKRKGTAPISFNETLLSRGIETEKKEREVVVAIRSFIGDLAYGLMKVSTRPRVIVGGSIKEK